MFEIEGTYATAKCYATNIEQSAIEQIRQLCSQEVAQGSKVAIMPDAHAGAGCVVGCTMTVTDKVIPNVVGVDIGCGMYTVNVGTDRIDFDRLDVACHSIPSGRNVWKLQQESFDLELLCCYDALRRTQRIESSIGTLGGGNHFIEVDVTAKGTKYLVIHSGSRNLGTQVAEHYQRLAIEANGGKALYRKRKSELVAEYRAAGRDDEIQSALRQLESLKAKGSIPPELCYVEGQLFEDYLHDVALFQDFARLNREVMAAKICELAGLSQGKSFHTVHNYIDTDELVLRKGAIAAHAGECVLIPLNMRDGSVVAVGRGNSEWNNSAPHGAGRVMSRREARDTLSLRDYERSMQHVYTSTACAETLDEAPMAYKAASDILGPIGDAVKVIEVMKPLYNFKATE